MIKKNHKLYPFVDLVERFVSVKTCLGCAADAGKELSTPTEPEEPSLWVGTLWGAGD